MAKPGQERPRLYAEDEHGATVILKLSRNRHYPGRFLTMFIQTLEDLCSVDRPKSYFKVLLYLMTELDPMHYRRLMSDEISRSTGLSKPSIWRAMAMLQEDRVIFAQGETSGRAYRMNHNLCWMSSAERFNEMQDVSPDPPIKTPPIRD